MGRLVAVPAPGRVNIMTYRAGQYGYTVMVTGKGPKVQVGLTLPLDLVERLDALAEQVDVSRAELIRAIVTSQLERDNDTA